MTNKTLGVFVLCFLFGIRLMAGQALPPSPDLGQPPTRVSASSLILKVTQNSVMPSKPNEPIDPSFDEIVKERSLRKIWSLAVKSDSNFRFRPIINENLFSVEDSSTRKVIFKDQKFSNTLNYFEILPDDKSFFIYEDKVDGDLERNIIYFFKFGDKIAKPISPTASAIDMLKLSPNGRFVYKEYVEVVDLKKWRLAVLDQRSADVHLDCKIDKGLLKAGGGTTRFKAWSHDSSQLILEQYCSDPKHSSTWKAEFTVSLRED